MRATLTVGFLVPPQGTSPFAAAAAAATAPLAPSQCTPDAAAQQAAVGGSLGGVVASAPFGSGLLLPRTKPAFHTADDGALRTTHTPSPNNTSVHPGWKGLLEISRNSGASGVVGSKVAVDEDPTKDAKLEICCTAHTSPAVRRLVKGVIRGLKACQDPEKAKEGMGGTYFFMNENGRKVAILKPCDEEPLAPNNPKGYVGRALGEPGWKPTVRVGEAAMREVAAYLLDHEGWAKVPTTTLVRARHAVFCYNSRMSSVRQSSLDLSGLGSSSSAGMDVCVSDSDYGGDAMASGDASSGSGSGLPMKLGSLQEFVSHMCDTSEMGPSRFAVRDVHRIGILDVRLFNTDRHAGNMLVRAARQPSSANLRMPALGESAYELVPIDHGFCLPETLEACYFEWLHWPQAMLPFSEEELEYINKIDIEADKALLRRELPNLRPECLRVMELATSLLKAGAAAGLSLHEIASVMTRPFEGGDEEPSELEKLAAAARSAMQERDACPDSPGADDECCDDVIDEEDESEASYASDDDCVTLCGAQHAAGVVVDSVSVSGMARALSSPANARLAMLSPRPVLTQASSREEESMLFELEEDSTGGGALMGHGLRGTPRGAAVVAGLPPRTPGEPSLGSSVSSSTDDFSFVHPSSSLTNMAECTSLAAGGVQVGVPAAGTAAAQPALATSVHVTDGGFVWRRFKARASAKRASHLKRSGGGCAPRGRGHRTLYPPPVAAFAPDSLSGLFTDMDDGQWASFMDTWRDALAEALESGCLRRAVNKDTPVAQSCPRF